MFLGSPKVAYGKHLEHCQRIVGAQRASGWWEGLL